MFHTVSLRTAARLTLLLLANAVSTALRAQAGPSAFRDSMSVSAISAWGVELRDRDPKIKPGENFYLSQNGGWLARTVLSAQNPAFAYWRDVQRLAPRRTTALLRAMGAATSVPAGSPEAIAGAFYRAYADQRAIEAKGLTPLRPQLEAIRAIRTRSQLAAVMGSEAGPGTERAINFMLFRYEPALFSVSIGQDPRDPTRNAVFLVPNGLLLPGPEYYTDASLADVKAEYERYIARVLGLLGWSTPDVTARDIVALESRIAGASLSHEQTRLGAATDTVLSLRQLNDRAPGFDWRAFLKGAELGNAVRFTVRAAGTFSRLAKVFAETPIAVWQARQAFAIADIDGQKLSDSLYRANFDFRVRQFNSSLNVPPPRGNDAGTLAEPNIGEIVGTLYCDRYGSPEVNTTAKAMAEDIRKALDARLGALDWVTPDTRRRAREKVAQMQLNVGCPVTRRGFAGLVMSDTDFFGNILRARAFHWRDQVRHLDDRFDRSAWATTPQTATYSYSLASNAMELPASLLEPPFFDPHADAAVNFGAVGALMGGQMFAALDEHGRHYDSDGRRTELFTPDEARRFAAMRQEISDQYSAVEPLPGLRIKGELVADEAIDDLGGLLVALDAYHASLGGKPAPMLDGFTGDQRFFLSWAQMWRVKFSTPFIRAQLATGTNAPPFMRVNGPVSHIAAWYDAFNVQPGDAMYIAPERRVRLW